MTIKLNSGATIIVENLPSRGVSSPRAGLWTGEGPPPDSIPGSAVGDEYLDLLTGELFRLEPGD